MRPDLSDIPERLARRPLDNRRGLPIPYANVLSFSPFEFDFTVVSADRSVEVAQTAICGLCADPLDYLAVAFLGGAPKGDGIGVYTDPPMHEDCAVAATRLCPHLRLSHARRVKEERQEEKQLDLRTGPGWSESKPDAWHLTIWNGYAITLLDEVLCYVPGYRQNAITGQPERTPMVRERLFSYTDDGLLREVT